MIASKRPRALQQPPHPNRDDGNTATWHVLGGTRASSETTNPKPKLTERPLLGRYGGGVEVKRRVFEAARGQKVLEIYPRLVWIRSKDSEGGEEAKIPLMVSTCKPQTSKAQSPKP